APCTKLARCGQTIVKPLESVRGISPKQFLVLIAALAQRLVQQPHELYSADTPIWLFARVIFA
ncbi:MAG: hypothetical protein WCB79_00665, partial [Halobacteriota archaeon]